MSQDIFARIEAVVEEIYDTSLALEEYQRQHLAKPKDLADRIAVLQEELKVLQSVRATVWNDGASAEIKLWKSVIDMAFKDIFARPRTTVLKEFERAHAEIDRLTMSLPGLGRNRRAETRTKIRKKRKEIKEIMTSNFMTAFDFLMAEENQILLERVGIDPQTLRETMQRQMISAPSIRWRNARLNYNNYVSLKEMEAAHG